MYILGIVGSARKGGNTDTVVDAILTSSKECGAQVEKIYLSDLDFKGCIGCGSCEKDMKCILKDDMQEVYSKINKADGLVLGSPTYFYNVSGLMKMFIDRLYAYEIFDKEYRSVWVGAHEVLGRKYAVTAAICEQETIEDMGFASEAMSMALSAVGIRSVENMKILHLFKKNEAGKNEKVLESSKMAGVKLYKTIELAREVIKKG